MPPQPEYAGNELLRHSFKGRYRTCSTNVHWMDIEQAVYRGPTMAVRVCLVII